MHTGDPCSGSSGDVFRARIRRRAKLRRVVALPGGDRDLHGGGRVRMRRPRIDWQRLLVEGREKLPGAVVHRAALRAESDRPTRSTFIGLFWGGGRGRPAPAYLLIQLCCNQNIPPSEKG